MRSDLENSPRFFDPRTLARLKGLPLRARHIVEGYVAGLHRSPYRGFSIEFAEHREYAPGDDLRYVDWKVFGRTDKFYLKQFEDETNLLCHLLLDVSHSMTYRGPDSPLAKLEYAQCMAAALAWLVLHQQDSVGLATFDDQVRSVVRPSGSPDHWPQLLTVMEQAESRPRTSLGKVLPELAARLTRRGVVVLLSDLFDEPSRILEGLRHFRHRRHDVVVLHMLDPAEIEFPFNDLQRFIGLEGEMPATVDARSVRQAYLDEFQQYLRTMRTGCLSLGMDYQLIRTDVSFDRALAGYLATRLAKGKP
jgi:uncharacterized protein (DUF58 family)